MDGPNDSYDIILNHQEGDEEEERRRRRGFIPPWLGFIFLAGVIAGILVLMFFPILRRTIEVRASSDCLSCHGEMLAALKRKYQHAPFAELRCVACHEVHGKGELLSLKSTDKTLRTGVVAVSGQDLNALFTSAKTPVTRFDVPKPARKANLRKEYKELCRDCHSATMAEAGKRYSMPPFTKGQCASCHASHSSDYADLTTKPIKTMCLSCHPEVAKYYNEKVLHPPFREGSCTSCHKAHASNHKPLLRRSPKVLCFACHQPMAKWLKKPVQMEPFTQGKCPKCHNPHGSPNAKLLQMPLPKLCFSCHQKVGQLQKKAVMMEPFRQGRCLQCHLPHGSDYSKLLQASLKGNDLCFRCHAKYKQNYQPIGHNRIVRNASPYQPEGGVGSCLNCHEPHAANFGGLVQKESISLCLSCHGPRSYFAHPVGIKWDDPWRGSYLRCTSCHNPMGSGIARLKRRDKDGLCVSCHQADDPAYIYYSTGSRSWHNYRIPGSEGG